MEYKITVIIPAYNVERFVEKAVLSALDQKEVGEVIVVNDGSTDNTDVLINKLAIKYNKIKIFYHKNKINKGRSATRNLGISKASSSLIAFLDADDFYLDNRFKNDIQILTADSNLDGVYNAIGVKFYRDFSQQEYEERKLTTLRKVVPPDQLFETLIYSRFGHFSLDGYLIKKSLIMKIGGFDEDLNVGEDNVFILKSVLKGKVVSGQLDTPVAIRGVHDKNIFNNKTIYIKVQYKIYESLLFWGFCNAVPYKDLDFILDVLWRKRFKNNHRLLENFDYWFFLFSKKSKYMFSRLGLKYFPIVRKRKDYFSFLYTN